MANGKFYYNFVAIELPGDRKVKHLILNNQAEIFTQVIETDNSQEPGQSSSDTDAFNGHRYLVGATSASQSIITGTGIVSNTAMSTYTVTVIAKDSSGNNRGVGGDPFFIKIDNQCNLDVNFNCNVVGGAEATISSPIFAAMTDHGNGNYSYSYTVNNDGMLTIAVLLMQQNTILVEYYPNYSLSGSPTATFIIPSINHNWGSGSIFGLGFDNVSLKFISYFRAPVTGTYTFYLDSDDGSTMNLGGTTLVSKKGESCM
jgi:hypothetical protein